MEKTEIEIEGRKYLALVSPESGTPGAMIIIGPPEGLVDGLGLPSETATRLHNILYSRRIFTYKDISRPGAALGALQEALNVDAQKLAEAFSAYETETVGG